MTMPYVLSSVFTPIYAFISPQQTPAVIKEQYLSPITIKISQLWVIPNSGPFLGIILPNSVWYGVYSDLSMMQEKKKKRSWIPDLRNDLIFEMTRFQHNPLNSILMGPHIEFQIGMMALSYRDFNVFFFFFFFFPLLPLFAPGLDGS